MLQITARVNQTVMLWDQNNELDELRGSCITILCGVISMSDLIRAALKFSPFTATLTISVYTGL